MQAITTKFAGPTNHRGSRIIATALGALKPFRVTVDWDHALNPQDNHAAAARTLAERRGWSGRWEAGETPDGRGYVFVNVGRSFNGFTIAPAEEEG